MRAALPLHEALRKRYVAFEGPDRIAGRFYSA
jgi:hypothetical protein